MLSGDNINNDRARVHQDAAPWSETSQKIQVLQKFRKGVNIRQPAKCAACGAAALQHPTAIGRLP